jgi:phosphatidylserine/phosphatidylglycerophosphate/cardiolipin synthase-like enzyme
MHNKFCIIDSETVINGSYNWTKKANFNKENITIDKDRGLAKRFANEFKSIKTGN